MTWASRLIGASARRLLSVLDRDAAAELALGDELAVAVEAELAGDRQQIAGTDEGDVVGDRAGRLGSVMPSSCKFLFHSSGHCIPPHSFCDQSRAAFLRRSGSLPCKRRQRDGGCRAGGARVAYLRRNSDDALLHGAAGKRQAGPSPKRAERDRFIIVADAFASRGAVLALASVSARSAPAGAAPVAAASRRHRHAGAASGGLRPQAGETRGNSQVAGVRGRILYDFAGNACEGYSLEFRQVSELDSGEGKVSHERPALDDLGRRRRQRASSSRRRISSIESLVDTVDGHAERERDQDRGRL